MSKLPLPIAGGTYKSHSLPLSNQDSINVYPKIMEVQALSQQVLFGTPGLVQTVTSGSTTDDVNRGSHVFNDVPYFVNGTTLYKLVVTGVETYALTEIGTIDGVGRVSIADNGTQLMIVVPESKGYIYTQSAGVLEEISDTNFVASGLATHVVFIDSFFVCTTNQNKFIKSAANDGTDWDALDFGGAESDPDDIKTLIVYSNQLFIAGGKTFEAFSNIGGADFPFRRTGLFLDKGVFAPFSLIKTNNSFMFIGGGVNESPAVWRLAGNGVEKVSTTAIEEALQRFTQAEIEASFSWAYAQDGAYFVGFSFPRTTLVFDNISNLWHERKSQLAAGGEASLTRNRINSLVTAYGKIFCGDAQDGRIGILDPDAYTEYGTYIFRRFSTMPFQNNMNPLFVVSLELTMESGVGNDDCPDPQIRMDQSRDGRTFTDEKMRSVGKIGEYNKRQIWNRLGRAARTNVFRFTMTDAVKFAALQLTADIRGGI